MNSTEHEVEEYQKKNMCWSIIFRQYEFDLSDVFKIVVVEASVLKKRSSVMISAQTFWSEFLSSLF